MPAHTSQGSAICQHPVHHQHSAARLPTMAQKTHTGHDTQCSWAKTLGTTAKTRQEGGKQRKAMSGEEVKLLDDVLDEVFVAADEPIEVS